MAQSYKTGTVTVANGSTAVTGSGTAWELALITGGLFTCGGFSAPCTVVSDTSLTLDVPFVGTSGSGRAYSIFRETAQTASAVEANDRIAEVAYRLRIHSYINFDATGTLAQRANYNTAPKDFLYLQTDVSPFRLFVKRSEASGDWAGPNLYGQGEQGIKGDTGDTGPAPILSGGPTTTLGPGAPASMQITGGAGNYTLSASLPRGPNGWAPKMTLVSDGPARDVMRLDDWLGGEGTKPAGTGQYIGPTGFVSNISDAMNLKGQTGPQGPAGTPWQGQWDADTTYLQNDLVRDEDVLDQPAVWIALRETTADRPHESPYDWSPFPATFTAPLDYGLITQVVSETRDYGLIS